MQLVLRGADSKIRATFTGPDGEALVPTSPTVTVVRDSDSEAIATDAVCTSDGEGVVSFTIDGEDIPEVDLLRAEWSATNASAPNSEIEVVGGFLCSLEEIDPDGTASVVRRLREQAELWIEDACHVAFRPRYQRDTEDAMGEASLLPSRPLLDELFTLSVDGEDVDLGDLTVDETIRRPGGFVGEVSFTYSHGYASTPEPIRRAVVKLAQFAASAGDDRISRFREDDQEVWLAVGGIGGAMTSVPEVNAAIEQYRIGGVG